MPTHILPAVRLRPRTPIIGGLLALALAVFPAVAVAVAEDAAAAGGRAGAPSVAVIAHRGASGYRPENTLEAFALAVAQGADDIEVDLVPTKDGALVVRNDNELSGTTDVAAHPEFASRRTTKTVDGVLVTGWFSEDFTLREVRTLRAIERLPQLRPGNTAYNGQFKIPTLQETISAVKGKARLYLELKHPSYFRALGLPVEERVALSLLLNGLARRTAPVQVQAFEPSALQRLNRLLPVRLVQGLDIAGQPYDLAISGSPRTYADLRTDSGLRWIAQYADTVAVNAGLVVPRDADGRTQPATDLPARAHAAGLTLQAWTFRAENTFLPVDFRAGTDPAAHGDLAGYLRVAYDAGVDGVFVEFPDLAVAERDS